MRTRRDFLTPTILIGLVVVVLLALWVVICDAQTHTMPGSNVVPSGASLTINSGGSITAAAGSTVSGFGGTGYHSVTFIVDGSGYVLSTGTKNPVKVPFGGTLAGWVMTCKPSGSVTADVFRSSNTSGLPTTSIVGGSGTKPAVATNVENSSTSFTSWTSTAITAKDNLCISLSGVSTATYVQLTLYYQ